MTVMDTLGFFYLHFYVQAYWMPLCVMKILLTGQTSTFHGVNHITEFMKVKFVRSKDCPPLEPACVYFTNHRSWADFFIDQTLCGGAAYLSRRLVIIGTPMSALWAYLNHSTWFFERRRGIDREKFFQWIDENWQKTPEIGAIMYPEGTRNLSLVPLRLKSGVIQYAYNYKRPVQIIITTNKEFVVNEKKLKMNPGVTCLVHCSEKLDPEDYKSFDDFKTEVEEKFREVWHHAYRVHESGENLEEFQPPMEKEVPTFKEVPIKLRLWMVRMSVLFLTMFIGRNHIMSLVA